MSYRFRALISWILTSLFLEETEGGENQEKEGLAREKVITPNFIRYKIILKKIVSFSMASKLINICWISTGSQPY